VLRASGAWAWGAVALVLSVVAGCEGDPPARAISRPAGAAPSPAPVAHSTPAPVPPGKQGPPFILSMGNGVQMEFISIPTGSFTFGDGSNGIPRRTVTFDRPYYMAKTEVTQQQWSAVISVNPSAVKGPTLPVHRLSWGDCQDLVRKMNFKYSQSGMRFDIPGEAQWEYACRAGMTTRLDSPDDPNKIEQYAWLASNSQYAPHAVAGRKPNAWGLCDMQGNIAEWCGDVYNTGSDSLTSEARQAGSGPWYVVRGGNYRDSSSDCTSSSRLMRRAIVPMRQDGLRLMCTPK